jgi:hypothetical protein
MASSKITSACYADTSPNDRTAPGSAAQALMAHARDPCAARRPIQAADNRPITLAHDLRKRW